MPLKRRERRQTLKIQTLSKGVYWTNFLHQPNWRSQGWSLWRLKRSKCATDVSKTVYFVIFAHAVRLFYLETMFDCCELFCMFSATVPDISITMLYVFVYLNCFCACFLTILSSIIVHSIYVHMTGMPCCKQDQHIEAVMENSSTTITRQELWIQAN